MSSVSDLTQLVSIKERWERSVSGADPDPKPIQNMDGDMDPVLLSDRTTSTAKTTWNIANAIQSVSVLSLPYAILRGGWVALGAFVVVALMSNATGKFLIDCMYDRPLPGSLFGRNARQSPLSSVQDDGNTSLRTLINSNSETTSLLAPHVYTPVLVRCTYASIGRACWPFGGYAMVLLVQCVELLGVCSLSLLLMGSSMQTLVMQWASMPLNVWTAIAALVVLPTVLLPRLTQLGWLSFVGVFTIIGVVITILANSVSKYHEWSFANFDTPSLNHFPIALGIIVFGYAAHGQFPAFHIRMEKPLRFGFALNVAFSLMAVLDLITAVLGYLAYGQETSDVLSQNMSTPWNNIINVLLLINLLLSYALPMFVVSAIMDKFIRQYFPLCGNESGTLHLFYFVATRVFLVGLTLLVGVLVPNFHLLMSFIGSITCVLLVFVFPCTFHLVLHREHLSVLRQSVNVILALVATVTGIAGVYASYIELASGND